MSEDPREQEVKLAISDPSDLDRLIAALGEPDAVIEQQNTYFDTPAGTLRSRGAMLRIRKAGDSIVATLKSDATFVDGYMQCTEIEEGVAPAIWADVDASAGGISALDIPPVIRALALLDHGEKLIALGEARNTRRVYHRSGGRVFEVDRTVLPGGRVEAEIEVETSDPHAVRSELEALLNAHQIAWRPQSKTKYERFLEARGLFSG